METKEKTKRVKLPLWEAERRGTVWWVEFGNEVVAKCFTEATARQIVHEHNTWPQLLEAANRRRWKGGRMSKGEAITLLHDLAGAAIEHYKVVNGLKRGQQGAAAKRECKTALKILAQLTSEPFTKDEIQELYFR